MSKKIKFIVIGIVIFFVLLGGILFFESRDNENEIIEENVDSGEYFQYDVIYESNILSQIGELIVMFAENESNFSYEIVEEDCKINEEITLKIPQLQALEEFDDKDYSNVNQLIQKEIFAEVNSYVYDEGIKIMVEDYKYDVTMMAEQFVSVVFSGIITAEGVAHPNSFVKAINIRMLTNEFVELSDIVDDKERFINLVKADNTEYDGVYEAKKYVVKEISDDVLSADLFDYNNRVYCDYDGFNVIISVPHAIGDYTVAKVRFNDLKALEK